MNISVKALAIALAGGILAISAGVANAQGYPNKQIRLVVPFAPGGTTDILARAIGHKLTQSFGQPVIIDNRPGAGGMIGAEVVARSAPDGYTLLMAHIGTMAVNPSLYRKLPYDPIKSFSPVSLLAAVPNVLVVHPKVPANSLPELITYAKNNPGKLYYSSGGNGSAAHLAMEYFKLQTGTDIVHVPYKGTAPAVNDIVSGQVTMTMTGSIAVRSAIDSKQLRALAVSSPKRVRIMPDIPTVGEHVKGFDATQWYGIVAPAGTPKEIINKLNSELRTIMQSEEIEERLATEGATGIPGSPEDFAEHIKAEMARWATVIKAAGMRID